MGWKDLNLTWHYKIPDPFVKKTRHPTRRKK